MIFSDFPPLTGLSMRFVLPAELILKDIGTHLPAGAGRPGLWFGVFIISQKEKILNYPILLISPVLAGVFLMITKLYLTGNIPTRFLGKVIDNFRGG